MANRTRPTLEKRAKERARQEKRKQKDERRAAVKAQKEANPRQEGEEDQHGHKVCKSGDIEEHGTGHLFILQRFDVKLTVYLPGRKQYTVPSAAHYDFFNLSSRSSKASVRTGTASQAAGESGTNSSTSSWRFSITGWWPMPGSGPACRCSIWVQAPAIPRSLAHEPLDRAVA